MTKQPALLLVSRNFPPLLGGMERLNQKMLLELAQNYKTGLVGPEGAWVFNNTPTHIWPCSITSLSRFLIQAFFKALYAAKQLRPKIILAGSGLTAPIVWITARIFSAHCVVYLHGLDIEVKHSVYQWLWVPFFRHFDQVIVNSHFTRGLALEAGIPVDRISILHPGVSLPDLKYAAEKRRTFRKQYHIGNAPVMLYVGRITARKGLSVFAEHILPEIIQHHPTAQLIVIGDSPTLSLLQQNNQRQQIETVLADRQLEDKVKFLGWMDIDDESLSNAYFAADVLIFPVQSRPYDNEGFGMVAVEAAAHGLPTVAFAAGGVPDAVTDGISGRLVTAGDNAAFSRAVIELLSKPISNYRDSCCHFAESFSWSTFGQGIREICHQLTQKESPRPKHQA